MNIEHCSARDGDGTIPATLAEVHACRALEQAAAYAAALAIARWSASARTITPARAAWLARAHGNLQRWFAAGGFAQQENAVTADDADQHALPYPGTRPQFYDVLMGQGRSTLR